MKAQRIHLREEWDAVPKSQWERFAKDTDFQYEHRVTFAAYAHRAANNHANFERGELAQWLVREDGKVPDRRTVWSAIQRAISQGYLVQGSRQLCLIVPTGHLDGGIGDPEKPCRRNHKTQSQNVRSTSGHFGQNVRAATGPSGTNVRATPGRSTREASISLLHKQTSTDMQRAAALVTAELGATEINEERTA